MLDGFKIHYQITNFEAWKKAVNIDLFTPTDLETGAAKDKTRAINGGLQKTITHRGEFETYQLTVKETTKTQVNGSRSVSFFLIITGSFHKNHFGRQNYSPFTWDNLQTEMSKLEKGLKLSDITQLVNLEIGLNIPLTFPAFPFLKQNLISYKGNQFNRYNPDKSGFCLGYVCLLNQYSVKVYDKGKQFNLPEPLMRFELRYIKMQKLKKMGIKHLTDLRDFCKVNNLLELLLAAWDNILLFDSCIDLKLREIKQCDRELLSEGRRPGYWEQLKRTNPRKFKYQRNKFRLLVEKYGQGWHSRIRELIQTQWESRFKNCPILPSVQTLELSEFTVKVKGNIGQIDRLQKEGLMVLWLGANRSIYPDQRINRERCLLGGLH